MKLIGGLPEPPDWTTIGDRVRWARLQLKLSQKEVADRAGVSTGTIGNLESGQRQIPRELLAIAAALQVSPQWLKTGRGPVDFLPEELVGVKVPLLTWSQATYWKSHIGVIDMLGWAEAQLTEPGDRAFALRVTGDSMPAQHSGVPSFPADTVIFADPTSQARGQLRRCEGAVDRSGHLQAARPGRRPLVPQAP